MLPHAIYVYLRLGSLSVNAVARQAVGPSSIPERILVREKESVYRSCDFFSGTSSI